MSRPDFASIALCRAEPAKPFRFLALPRELRDAIYSYLLLLPECVVFERPYHLLKANWAGWVRSQDDSKAMCWMCHVDGHLIKPHAAILRACRQSFDEAARVLYGSNRFVIPLPYAVYEGSVAEDLPTTIVTAPYFKDICLSLRGDRRYDTIQDVRRRCSQAGPSLSRFTGLDKITLNAYLRVTGFERGFLARLLPDLGCSITGVTQVIIWGSEDRFDAICASPQEDGRAEAKPQVWQRSKDDKWVVSEEC